MTQKQNRTSNSKLKALVGEEKDFLRELVSGAVAAGTGS